VPFYSAKWPSRTGGAITYLTMNMIQSLLDNGYFTDRNGRVIRVDRYIVQPVYQDGELHVEFVDTTGQTNVIWANTPQSVATRLALVPENDLPGAAFWEYSFGNAAAWEVVRRQLRDL
jgi:spore germination protein YaaH